MFCWIATRPSSPRLSSSALLRWPGVLPRASLQLIRDFGDAGLGTGFLLRASHGGTAQTHAADRVLAGFDGNAALEGNDVRQHALSGQRRFRSRAPRPLGRRPPEGQGRVSLAAGEFKIVRRGPIALEKNANPARAIDDGDRSVDAALRQRRLRDRQGHVKRNVALRQNLGVSRSGKKQEHCKRECGGESNRHESLRFFGLCGISSPQASDATAMARSISKPPREALQKRWRRLFNRSVRADNPLRDRRLWICK